MTEHNPSPEAAASILIVEDEVIVAIELREKLRAAGWRVSGLATSGAEAFALAEADPPDLVLMDITIKGGMDGIETARRLQDLYGASVIFITAFVQKPSPRRSSRSHPPFLWLSKPIVDEDLLRAIRTALTRRRARPGAHAPRGPLEAAPEQPRRRGD